jgi:hypothetical protein
LQISAFAHFVGYLPVDTSDPGVSLRYTPGFMLTPAAQV